MPGEEEPEEVMDDKAFEAMLEDFDQDALEAAPKEADPKEPEPLVEGPEEAQELVQNEEAEDEIEPPPAEGRERRDLKAEATSLRHLLTHLPKNPYCVSCQQAKMRQRYSHKGAFKRDLDHFGEIVTCDHVVAPAMRMQGLGGEKYGLSVRDLFTGMIAIYPSTNHDTPATLAAMKEFAGRKKIHNIYSDNALELVKASYLMGVGHHASLPGEPKTNSLIERTNQSNHCGWKNSVADMCRFATVLLVICSTLFLRQLQHTRSN